MATWTLRSTLVNLLTVFIAYTAGYFQHAYQLNNHGQSLGSRAAGKVIYLDEIPAKPVNHDISADATDKRPIMKRVMISNGEIPHLTGFSAARLEPGQQVPRHSHKTMHEVFFVKDGTGTFDIDGQMIDVKKGTLM
jgi:hypothetical protein